MVASAASSSHPASRSTGSSSARSTGKPSSTSKTKSASPSPSTAPSAKNDNTTSANPNAPSQPDPIVRDEKRRQFKVEEALRKHHIMRMAEPASEQSTQSAAKAQQQGAQTSDASNKKSKADASAQTSAIPPKTSLPQSLENDISTLKDDSTKGLDKYQAEQRIKSALKGDTSNPDAMKTAQDTANRVAHEMMQKDADPAFEKIFDHSFKKGNNERVQELGKSLPATPATQAKIDKHLSTLTTGNTPERGPAEKRLQGLADKTRPANGQAIFDKAQNIIGAPPKTTRGNTANTRDVERFLSSTASEHPAAQQALDHGKIQRAVSDLSVPSKRDAAKAHLDQTMESGTKANKNFATDQLVKGALNPDTDYRAQEYIQKSTSPESYDAAAKLVAQNKNMFEMEDKLASGGKTALASIERNWDAIQQNDPGAVTKALKTPQAAQALKDGDPPGLERVYRDSLAAEKSFSPADSRIKALGATDTPAARDALVDLAQHPSGAGAGAQLTQNAEGRKAALDAFEQADTHTKTNLADAALHPDQANQGKARAQLMNALDSSDAVLQQKAFTQAKQFSEANPSDAALQNQLFEKAAKGVAAADQKTANAANDLLKSTLSTEQIKAETSSTAFTQIGEAMAQNKNVADSYWAKDARRSIEGSQGAYGGASLHAAIQSKDPKQIAESLGGVNSKGLELVQGQLAKENPPRDFGSVLSTMKQTDQPSYEKALDTMSRKAESPTSPMKTELKKQLAEASNDPSDPTVEDFAKRNLGDGFYQSQQAAKALGSAGTERATQALVDANQEGRGHARSTNDALAQVLDGKGNPDTAKEIAARHLSTTSPDAISKNAMESLVTHAAKSTDPALKEQVRNQLPSGPLTDANLERVATSEQKRLQKAIEDAPEGSDMHALGQLYQAKAMAQDDSLKGKVDTKKIDQAITDLHNKDGLKQELEAIKTNAVKDVFGRQNPAQLQEDYLKSDAFQQRLRLMDGPEQQSTVKKELGRLALLDHQKAGDTSNALMRKSLQQNGLQMFQKLDGKDKVDGLSKVIAETTGQTKGATQIAQSYANYLSAADSKTSVLNQNRQVNQMIDADIASAQKAGDLAKATKLQGLKGTIQKLEQKGVLGSIGALAGITSIATGGIDLKSPEGVARAFQNGVGLAGSADDVAKLTSWLTKGTKTPGVGKLIGGLKAVGKFGKVLGPVGSVVGGALDVKGAIDDYKAGDMHGFGAKLTSGVAGASALATGGLMSLGLVSGPVGWAAVAGAGVVSAGAWAWDNTFGETDEESFFRRGVVIDGQEQNFWIG